MKTSFAAGLLAILLQSQPSALRIVVLEGEDAVNIVQQKTAVRPLVEVRDRNDLPVAGATVTFTIGSGQPAAFAGGVQTLTVTTNAAGQAAASGLNALGAGTVQIQVQAAYQGQLATAAISQTNFATAAAAQAAAAGNAGASTSGGASGAAGSGGGMSGTTLGITGAAVAGGALAVTQLGGGAGADDAEDAGVSFNGSLTGQVAVTVTSTSSRFVSTCVTTYAMTGTVTITLRQNNTAGTIAIDGARHFVSNSPAACPPPAITSLPFRVDGDITGGPSDLVFRSERSFTGPVPDGGTGTSTETLSFTGGLSGGVISGTLVYQTRGTSTGSVNAQGIPYTTELSGSTTITLTLR